MALTLIDVWSDALLRVGLPADDGYLAPVEVRRALVNKAQRDVASAQDWAELQVELAITLSGPGPYPLPGLENLLHINWVAINGITLVSKQRREILTASTDAPGEPREWSVGGNGVGQLQLWVKPVPNQTYSALLSYTRKPDLIYNDTDQLLVPDHLGELVTTRTAYLMAVRKQEQSLAGMLMSEYTADLNDHRDEANVRRGPIVPRIRRDW